MKKSLIILPALIEAQDTPRSYISFETGSAKLLNQFTAGTDFYHQDLATGFEFGVNAVYFINNFGVAASYGQMTHLSRKPRQGYLCW